MRIALRLVIGAILAGAVIAAWPTCAYACSCRPPGTPAEELGQSDAVFRGTVVSVKAPTGPVASSADSTTVTFSVSTVWKGQITQTRTITTPGSSASCGVSFEQGKEYVVYGRANEGALTTNLCSRTRTIEEASEDIAAFGAGQPPSANAQTPGQLPATGAAPFSGEQFMLTFIGLSLVMVGVLVVAINRRAEQ